jgi:hypothetical protein
MFFVVVYVLVSTNYVFVWDGMKGWASQAAAQGSNL